MEKVFYIFQKDNFNKIRPPEHYKDENIAEKKISQRNENESGNVFFDDILKSNQKAFDLFFHQRTSKDLDVYFLSQSNFDLPKTRIGKNCNVNI